MLKILGLITVNGKQVLEVSGVPSTDSGVAAPLGSLALYEGSLYIKIGAASLDWELIPHEGQIEGLISSAIAPFESRLTTEIADRVAADLVLDGRISQEVADRMAYDAELEGMILAETSARSSADALLRSDLEDEAALRSSEDVLLGSRISQEVSDREQADIALGLRIDQEAATRLAADVAIDGRLDVLEGPYTVEGSVAKALYDAKAYTDMESATRASEDIRILNEAKAYTDMESATRASEDIRILNEAKAYTDMESSFRESEDIRILNEAKAYTDMEASVRESEDIRILDDAKAYTDMGLAGKADIMHYHVASDITDFTSAARDAAVEDQIMSGAVDIAPSQNAVYQALAGKADTLHYHTSGDITDFLYAARAAAVIDQIMSGAVDIAPSANAVYTALAGKANLSGGNMFYGAQTFNDDVTIHGDLTIDGDLTYVNTQELTVKDPLITLNKGGSSVLNSGIEIEVDGSIAAYLKLEPVSVSPAAPLAWTMKVPGQSPSSILGYRSRPNPVEGTLAMFVDGEDSQLQRLGGFTYSAAGDSFNITKELYATSVHFGDAVVQGDFEMKTEDNSLPVEFMVSRSATVTNSATPLGTYASPEAGTYEARVTAVAADGSMASYVRTALVKNTLSGLVIVVQQTDFTAEEVLGWDSYFEVSTGNLRVMVKGPADQEVKWGVVVTRTLYRVS